MSTATVIAAIEQCIQNILAALNHRVLAAANHQVNNLEALLRQSQGSNSRFLDDLDVVQGHPNCDNNLRDRLSGIIQRLIP